jgi:hypothetical protein
VLRIPDLDARFHESSDLLLQLSTMSPLHSLQVKHKNTDEEVPTNRCSEEVHEAEPAEEVWPTTPLHS